LTNACPSFARRATLSAIATACFCGLPAAISVRIFWEMASRESEGISGMTAVLVYLAVGSAIACWAAPIVEEPGWRRIAAFLFFVLTGPSLALVLLWVVLRS